MQDLYDNQCFQFVSATPAPGSVAAGVLTWNNLGPLTAGSNTNVTVTLKAIGNCNPSVNTARVQGATDNLGYVATTQESTVNIDIEEPPVANDDIFCIQGATSFAVLANDTDPDITGFLSANAG